MTSPDDLLAVAALRRCLERRDYAGAGRLITLRATLDGLGELAGYAEHAWQSTAERAYRESVAAWRADHEASVRQQQERDVRVLVALIAELFTTEAETGAAASRRAA